MVAIKTIRLEGLAASTASLEDLLKRFKQEARVAAQLKHPNIVTLYDVGTWEGLSYISMEFVDGVGLDRVISGSGKMVDRARRRDRRPGGRGARLTRTSSGIVHRDIKPANIMIEPGDHVKVTDFGIAKIDRLGRAPDGHRQPPRDAVLHEPGAGARRRDRRPQRPVLGRLRPLRDGRRPAGVPRRVDHGAALQDHHRGAAVAARARPDRVGRDAADHRQGALEGARDALPERAASWPTTCWRSPGPASCRRCARARRRRCRRTRPRATCPRSPRRPRPRRCRRSPPPRRQRAAASARPRPGAHAPHARPRRAARRRPCRRPKPPAARRRARHSPPSPSRAEGWRRGPHRRPGRRRAPAASRSSPAAPSS